MTFRLSRQLFYVVAAGCMCTWICITYLVVKNGTKRKRSDEDFYTQHGFVLSEDYDITDEIFEDVGNLSKVWNKNDVNRLDKTPGSLDEDGDNKTDEEKETMRDVYSKDNDSGGNEEKIIKEDFLAHEIKEGENIDKENEGNHGQEEAMEKVDFVHGHDHSKENENMKIIHNKNDRGNINKNVEVDREDNDDLKWKQKRNRNNENSLHVKYENIGGAILYNENIKNGKLINSVNQERDETSKKVFLHVEDPRNGAEQEVDDDAEEDEVDRIAKYRDFDDKNAHEHVLDDGENDSYEDEDQIGDDNENDTHLDQAVEDEINANAYVRSREKSLANERFEKKQSNLKVKGDITQGIKKSPNMDPKYNKTELKLAGNILYHVDQLLAREFDNNDENLFDSKSDDAFRLKDNDTGKNKFRPVQIDGVIKFNRQKQNNELPFKYFVDRIDKAKLRNKTFDKKKDLGMDIPEQNLHMDNMMSIKNKKLKSISPNTGENGTGVTVDYEKMPLEVQQKMDKLYRIHGFNAYISDRISVNRTLPDVRSERCKQKVYNVNPATTNLPQTSVVIVFHNEARSVLLRTLFSVINRSPDYLLKDIILVDDFSILADNEKPLEHVISKISKVHLIRTPRHEGLIRARLIGSKLATAPVLTFLDAHVECFKGWLEPLLERLVEKSDTVVCPQLQSISGSSFKITLQDQLYVGTFQLSNLVFDWLPVQYMDKHLQSSEIDTVRTPVFAGGHFSIYKSYFYKIGSYDKEINLWGAENLELSFRVWMCGGTVEIHPCSHVAHVYRQTNPLEVTMKEAVDEASIRNNLRTAAVWMDGFMKFYKEKGIENVDIGNITDRLELRKQLHCKSFQWYIDNVHPGLYVPGSALKLGEIWNSAYNVCIDSGISVLSTHISASKCRNKTSQFWHLSKLNALQRETGCVEYPTNITKDPRPTLERCDGGGPSQNWVYTKNGWIFNPNTHLCLGLTAEEKTLQILKCEHSERFQWEWRNNGTDNFSNP